MDCRVKGAASNADLAAGGGSDLALHDTGADDGLLLVAAGNTLAVVLAGVAADCTAGVLDGVGNGAAEVPGCVVAAAGAAALPVAGGVSEEQEASRIRFAANSARIAGLD